VNERMSLRTTQMSSRHRRAHLRSKNPYRHLMGKSGRIKSVVLTFACLTVGIVSTSSVHAQIQNQKPDQLNPTKVVTVYPKYGYAPKPIKVRLSRSEIDVIKRLQIASFAPMAYPTNATSLAVFFIDPGAKDSPTLALGIKSMIMAGELLASAPDGKPSKTAIIVGRTQSFIADTIRSLGCNPDFSAISGALLMGATICNRQVIVINLSGYLFIKNRSQSLTTAMETAPEPPMSATSYLYADRNIGGLAHEWAHVSRSFISHGLIADNEPAWFREGFAELISGMARVRASTNGMTYLNFHVIRIRKFESWPNHCDKGTNNYRATSAILGGCEYLRGLIALELLVANYGGIKNLINLYDDMRVTADFFSSFQHVYKMSVSTFENKADNYFRYITQAATYKP